MARRRGFARWPRRWVSEEYAFEVGRDALARSDAESRQRFACCGGERRRGHAAGCRYRR